MSCLAVEYNYIFYINFYTKWEEVTDTTEFSVSLVNELIITLHFLYVLHDKNNSFLNKYKTKYVYLGYLIKSNNYFFS